MIIDMRLAIIIDCMQLLKISRACKSFHQLVVRNKTSRNVTSKCCKNQIRTWKLMKKILILMIG